MPADITDPSGIEYALESKKGPSEENALALSRESIRHSASHIMAEAVRSIFPEAKFAIGPQPRTASTTTSSSPVPSPTTTCPLSRRRWPRPSQQISHFSAPRYPAPKLGTCSETSPSSWRSSKPLKTTPWASTPTAHSPISATAPTSSRQAKCLRSSCSASPGPIGAATKIGPCSSASTARPSNLRTPWTCT